MNELLQAAISIACIFFLGFFLIREIREGRFISFSSLFMILVIVDVYIPALFGAVSGKYKPSPLYPILDNNFYFYATVIYTCFMVLFFFGFSIKKRLRIRENSTNYKDVISDIDICNGYRISETPLFVIYWIIALFVLLDLYFEYKSCGSWDAFYQYKITRSYLVTVEYSSVIGKIVSLTSGFRMTLLFMATSIGFIDYEKTKHQIFWKRIAPIISFVLVLTSLYRGTIFNYICLIVVCIQIRNGSKDILRISAKFKRKIKKIIIFGVFAFILYGTVRTILNNKRWDIVISFYDALTEMIVNTIGTSLVSLTRCVQYVLLGGNLLFGQTYGEMFYSFIPRSIWVDKPVQYGIISIDIAMGMPATTMSAVSTPGEIITNFGFFGLLLSPIIGWVFKQLSYLRFSWRYKYFYASIVSGLMTTTLWMGFTGFFATLKYFFVFIIILRIVVRKE